MLLDFSIQVKDYLSTKDPAHKAGAEALYERILPYVPSTDPRRPSVDALMDMLRHGPRPADTSEPVAVDMLVKEANAAIEATGDRYRVDADSDGFSEPVTPARVAELIEHVVGWLVLRNDVGCSLDVSNKAIDALCRLRLALREREQTAAAKEPA